jgi:transaldolase
MKIFVSTASAGDVQWATEGGLADGVLTSPGSLRDAAGEGEERALLADICRATTGPVCATVGAVTATDIYRDARELAKISDQILVQVPLLEEAVGAMRRLRADGVRVVATLVYSAAQAVLAAKAGAFMVSVALDQLDAVGHDGTDLVRTICTLFAAHGMECDVLAALPRHAAQFAQCAEAGADVVAVTPDVLRALLLHPLTDRGLDQFLRELSVHHRPRATV